MASELGEPVNIGREEMVTIDELAHLIMRIAGKRVTLKHIPGPLGRGRTSDNRLILLRLGWAPTQPLEVGIRSTYEWIAAQAGASASRCKVPQAQVAAH